MYIRQVGNKFRVEIEKLGIRESQMFVTRAEGKAWGAARELEIERGANARQGVGVTLHEAIDRFVMDECPKRRGDRWERVRLERIKREMPDKRLDKVTADDITVWRNMRLATQKPNGATISAPTVRREMNLLKTVLETARRDWGWIQINPMADVKRPAPGKARTRIFHDDEVQAILAACGYTEGRIPRTIGQRMCVSLLIALETGMRAGEIGRAKVVGRVAEIPVTKNGDARSVPLSTRAVKLFEDFLPISSGQIDSAFRAAKIKAGLHDSDLHFHDSRATACTRLARMVDVLTLSRIIGHRDLKSLQIYYRESAESIADRLG